MIDAVYGVGAKNVEAHTTTEPPQATAITPVIHAHQTGGNQAEAAHVAVAKIKKKVVFLRKIGLQVQDILWTSRR